MAGKPLEKKGRSVFWISIALICAAIGTTLLLANDMRNLRAILRHYDIIWVLEAPPKSQIPASPLVRKQPVPPTIRLPAWFFETADPGSLGSFQRHIYVSGPQLCSLFNDAGILNAGWQSSPFDPNVSECISERKLARPEKPEDYASFFLSMKGTTDGAISVIRMKLILPDNADGEAMKHELVDAVRILIRETRWSDFTSAIERIDHLEDVERIGFGVDLKFFREFGDSRGFNLIFSLTGREPERLRTRSYFDRREWLPLPPDPLPAPDHFWGVAQTTNRPKT